MSNITPYILFYAKNVEKEIEETTLGGLSGMIEFEEKFTKIGSEIKKEKEERRVWFEEKRESELLKKRERELKPVKGVKKFKSEENFGKAVNLKDLDILKPNSYWNQEGKQLVENFKKKFEPVLGRQIRKKDEYDLDYDKGKLKKVKKKKKLKKKKLNFGKFVNMSEQKKLKLIQKREKVHKKKNFKKRYSKLDT